MTMKNRLPNRIPKLGASTAMTILLLSLVIPAAALVTAARPSASLDSLQVTVQTAANLPFQYSLTAYNTSGYQVASFTGNYPEAAFGLPDGAYLVTASAYYQQNYVCGVCALPAKSPSGATATPIRYIPPESEYGYAVVKLTGPAQITIATKNATQAPLVNIPVHVRFMNGTAAAGADVSGYVVGGNYLNSQQWVTYGQTGSDGSFTLLLPEAPIQVNAYISFPIQLPKNVSTVPVVVGGQKVNVTVYWQPSYVTLSGQALVLPPQMSADITLKVQPSSPYPIVYNSGGAPTAGAVTVTTTVGTTTAGAQQAGASQQSRNIAPFSPSGSQLSSVGQPTSGVSSGMASTELLVAITGAAVLIAGGFALLLSRRNRVQSARP